MWVFLAELGVGLDVLLVDCGLDLLLVYSRSMVPKELISPKHHGKRQHAKIEKLVYSVVQDKKATPTFH
jgi:hypothetical protein